MKVQLYNHEAGLSVKVGEGRGVQDLISGPKWKSTTNAHTHCTFRKEKAAGVVPAFTLLQKKSQVHFARASNSTSRSRQDQSEMSKRRPMHKLTSIFWASALELHCLSGERAEFSYVYSVPVSQLKCKPCVGHVFFVCFFQLTRSSVGVTANGLRVITTSAWIADNNKLIKRNKNKVIDFSHIVEVSLNSLIKYSVQEMKACKREEACSFTTKANQEETEWKN